MYKDYFGYKVYRDGRIVGRRGNVLATYITDKGYVLIRLIVNGKPTTKHVHRVLAECFLEKPEGATEVDHINCTRCDNRLENLRWVTKEQNVQHSYDSGNRNVTGNANANCKTCESIVHDICILLGAGWSAAKVRDFGFDYSLVRAIKGKRNWIQVSDMYFA